MTPTLPAPPAVAATGLPARVGGREIVARLRAASGAVLALWLASVATAAVGLLGQLLLAPYLGPRDYGVLVAATATVSLLAPLAEGGVGPAWLRLFGREGSAARRWVGPSLALLGLSSLAVVLALVLYALLPFQEPLMRRTLLLLLPLALFTAWAELAGAVLQLEGRFLALAALRVAPALLRLALALTVVLAAGGLPALTFGYAALFGPLCLLALAVARRPLGGTWRPATDESPTGAAQPTPRPGVPDALRATAPFACHTILYTAYYQAHVVLLAQLADEEAAGQYFIAYSCVMIATYVPTTIFQRYLLPRLHHWAEHDPGKLLLVYRVGLRSMLALGALAAAATAAAGLFLIEPLFGPAYAPAGGALALLALLLPVRFPVACLSALLVTRGIIALKLRLDLLALVGNVLLNLALIPALGIGGAVVASIASEVLIFLLYRRACLRRVLPAQTGDESS
jgi:O-antigen/teichoic acid export membrane protein